MSHMDHVLFLARKEITAYHEAAHAAAAIELGAGVERIELFPGLQEDGSIPDGITSYAGDFRDLSRADAITIFLAGPLTEKKLRACAWDKSKDDFRWIANLLRGSGLDIKALMAETERLLSQWWTAIELLQSELMHRRVLVGEEIIEAMTPWQG
jgi:hypothetical protein